MAACTQALLPLQQLSVCEFGWQICLKPDPAALILDQSSCPAQVDQSKVVSHAWGKHAPALIQDDVL